MSSVLWNYVNNATSYHKMLEIIIHRENALWWIVN